jgi:hypothetical protein
VNVLEGQELTSLTPAALATVETTQAAPHSRTHSHPHPRDLEEELIEEDYQRHSVEQVRSSPEPEGRDASHRFTCRACTVRVERGGVRVQEHTIAAQDSIESS